MSIQFDCPGCGKKYALDESQAGKQAKCPQCDRVFTVPPPEVKGDDLDDFDDYELEDLEDSLASPSVPAGLDDLDDMDDLDSDLGGALSADPALDAAVAESASAASTTDSAPAACPNCQAELKPGAVLCVSCGYNLKEKRKVEGVAAPVGAKPSKAKSSPLAGLQSVPRKYLAIGGGVIAAIVVAVVAMSIFSSDPPPAKMAATPAAPPPSDAGVSDAAAPDTSNSSKAKITAGEYLLRAEAEYKTLRTGSRKALVTSVEPLLTVTEADEGWTISLADQQWQGSTEELGSFELTMPMPQVTAQLPGLPAEDELASSTLKVTWSDEGPVAEIDEKPEWTEGQVERDKNSGSNIHFGQHDGFTQLDLGWISAADAAVDPEQLAAGIKLPSLVGEEQDFEPRDPAAWEDRPPLPQQQPPGQAAAFEGHGYPVVDFALLGDDRLLTAGGEGTARLWDLATGEQVGKYLVPEFSTGSRAGGSTLVDVSADGQRIVSASRIGYENCALRMWDLSAGLERPSTYTLEKKIRERGMSPAEQQRFSHIYGESALRTAMSNTKNNYRARSVDISPDGAWVAIDFSDGVGRVYDATSGRIVHEVYAGSGLRFVEDGKHLLAGEQLIETGSWKPSGQEVDVQSVAQVAMLTGQPIQLSGYQHSTQIPGGKGPIQLLGHESQITCLDYSDDRRFVVTGGNDGTVRVWRASDGRQLRRYRCYPPSIDETTPPAEDDRGRSVNSVKWRQEQLAPYRLLKVAFLPDGKRVLSTDAAGGVRLWDLSVDDPQVQPPYQIVHLSLEAPIQYTDISLDASGRYMQANRQLICDLTTGQVVFASRRTFAALSDGLRLAHDGQRIIDVQSGRVVSEFGEDLTIDPGAADFDATGKRFISGHCPQGQAGQITLWDAMTGQQQKEFLGHTKKIKDLKFLSDGKRFVSCAQDEQVLLWDIASGTSVALDEKLKADLLVVSPSGKFVAGGGTFGFRVWDTESREVVFETAAVSDAVFTPDDRHLVVTHGEYASPRFYETKAWKLAFIAQAVPPSPALAVSADGQYIVAVQNARRRGKEELPGGVQAIYLPPAMVGKPLVEQTAEPLVIRPPLNLVRTITAESNPETKDLFEAVETYRPLPDGRHGMIGTKENRAGIIDMQTGRTVCFLDGVTFRELVTEGRPWAHLGEGKLTAASSTGRISRWDLKTGARLEELLAEEEQEDNRDEMVALAIEAIAFGDDGSSAALVSGGKGLYLVDLRGLQPVGAAGNDGSRRGKNPVTPPPTVPKGRSTRGPQPLSTLSLVTAIPGDDDVLVCDRSGQIAVINGRSGRPASRFEGLSRPPQHLSTFDNGNKIIALDDKGQIFIWGMRNSKPELETNVGAQTGYTPVYRQQQPAQLACLPGSSLAVIAQQNEVALWDLDQGESLGQVYQIGQSDLNGLGFYSTGKHVFTLTDSELRIWEMVGK